MDWKNVENLRRLRKGLFIWILGALSLWALIIGMAVAVWPATCHAEDTRTINFEWDPCPEADIAGVRLYESTASGAYTYGPGNETAEVTAGINTASVTVTQEGTLYWVATAFDTQGNESGPSNEVTWTVDFTKPGAPILRFAGWE